MNKLFGWFSQNFFLLASLFLLAFIPLYPKLPLFDIVNTWVYVRIEDLFVAIIFLVYGISRVNKRMLPTSVLTIPVVVYWTVGLLCVLLSLIFVRGHMEGYFPHLVILHYLRRIEYMILVFVAFEGFYKKPQKLWPLLVVLAGTVSLIIAYGVGQKFFGLPAFLTMNEEFAKGVPLRLPPTARIPSTFGGHYDLAAYLVLMIPIFGSLAIGVKKFWQRIIFVVICIGSLITLLFTASRISFGVYLVAITTMLIWQKKRWLIIPVLIVSFVLLNYVQGASERFYKTIRFSDVIIDLSTGQPVGTVEKLQGGGVIVAKQESPAEESLPSGSGYINLPSQQVAQAPSKQYKTIETYTTRGLASGSGEIATVSGSFLVQKALVYDISITTRLQGQWPKALEAFKRDVLFGSGFSTLSLAADGDYLRMLGETGVVGTIAFLGIFIFAFSLFFKVKQSLEPLEKAFVIGVFAGIVGLFLNAILIDVFEASKVAFTLWILLGIALAFMMKKKVQVPAYGRFLFNTLTHPFAISIYLFITALVVYAPSLTGYFLGDDFTWLRWAATTRFDELPSYVTNAQGFFYRPIPKLWYFVLYSIFWLKPAGYHVANILLFSVSAISLFFLILKQRVRLWIGWIWASIFILMSIHHENVIWISGASSLLAAASLFVSILCFIQTWQKTSKYWVFYSIGAYLSLLVSMLSYDGMLVAPVLVVFIGFAVYSYRKIDLWGPLLLIVITLFLRIHAHAIWPTSGDYSYRLSALPINSVANTLGYFLATLGGTSVVERWAVLREQLKGQLLTMTVFGGLIAITVFVVFWIKRTWIKTNIRPFVWFVCSVGALVSYVGLGGMAERYALVSSGFLIVALAVWSEMLWQKKGFWILKIGVGILVIVMGISNLKQLSQVNADWQKASDISQKTLLTLKRSFFPLDHDKTFIFVNMPIRYGRAWIFPTGLTDALWHMFKFNPFAFDTVSVSSIKEAYDYKVIEGVTPERLVFEEYELKAAIKEVTTVEVEGENK